MSTAAPTPGLRHDGRLHAGRGKHAPFTVCDHGPVDVAWSDRREDVLSALRVLAAEPPVLDNESRDTRRPDLTNAVHWLIDDTSWDLQDPVTSIGTILRNGHEADAVREVVAVSERQGTTISDAAGSATLAGAKFGDSLRTRSPA